MEVEQLTNTQLTTVGSIELELMKIAPPSETEEQPVNVTPLIVTTLPAM
jgi:hypothetical protein